MSQAKIVELEQELKALRDRPRRERAQVAEKIYRLEAHIRILKAHDALEACVEALVYSVPIDTTQGYNLAQLVNCVEQGWAISIADITREFGEAPAKSKVIPFKPDVDVQ